MVRCYFGTFFMWRIPGMRPMEDRERREKEKREKERVRKVKA